MTLAHERRGHRPVVHPHRRNLAAAGAPGRELGGRQRAHADARPRELPHGQPRGQHPGPLDGGHPRHQGGIAAETGPEGRETSHGPTVQHSNGRADERAGRIRPAPP
ncbi:hypothetical protein ACFQV4_03810 [Streptomyces thermocarboxydus]